jgi:hypothetical protein
VLVIFNLRTRVYRSHVYRHEWVSDTGCKAVPHKSELISVLVFALNRTDTCPSQSVLFIDLTDDGGAAIPSTHPSTLIADHRATKAR